MTKKQFAGKAKPPTVTVKLGVPTPRHVEDCWVVRVDGEIMEAYPADAEGKRLAMRHRDKVLFQWKEAQRMARLPRNGMQRRAA